MVEVGYGRARVGSELSQLVSRWFVLACYKCTVFCLNSPKRMKRLPLA